MPFLGDIGRFFQAPQLGRRLLGRPDIDAAFTDFIRAPHLGERIIGGDLGRLLDQAVTERRADIAATAAGAIAGVISGGNPAVIAAAREAVLLAMTRDPTMGEIIRGSFNAAAPGTFDTFIAGVSIMAP